MAISALAGLGKLTELRQRILFVLGAMVVFRLGTHIPVPGVDPVAVAALFEQTRGSIVDVFNMFSGGALTRLSIFALGVMPYISASIIIQMMSAVIPQLEQLKKEGEAGRRKITQYTRYGTVVLATFQALGIAIAIEGQMAGGGPVVLIPGLGFKITTVARLVPGTMFLVWLGEQISERGIGNGISLIIFGSLVAGLPAAVAGTQEFHATGCVGASCRSHSDYWSCCVYRARPAADHRQLCKASTRSADDGRADQSFAVETQYGRGYSSNICIKHYSLSGEPRKLVRSGGRNGLVARHRNDTGPGTANLCFAVLWNDFILLFFLYGVGFQSDRDCRQLKEIGGFYPWYSTRDTECSVYRQGSVSVNTRWGDVSYGCLPNSRIYDCEMECAVLFRWDLLVDYCRSDDGSYVTSQVVSNVAPVRKLDAQNVTGRWWFGRDSLRREAEGSKKVEGVL